MRKALRQIMDSLSTDSNKKETDTYPSFKDKRYEPYILSKKNIHKFDAKNHNVKVSAIDGGNIEIIKSADLSIHLVRIYFNIFNNNKRLTPKTVPQKIDFYALAQSHQKDKEIYYRTRLIPLKEKDTIYLPDEKDLIFDSYDPTLTTGIFRTPVSKIGEISRRFAEWNISRHIIEQELDDGDILLRDGSLQTGITNESGYSESLYRSAEKKKVIFCGISKTSTLLTTSGTGLTSSISKIAENTGTTGTWYYHPIVKSAHPDHKAEMYSTRLNADSPYTFRFEIYDKQKESAITAIEQLAHTSKDISFPGYPYPLIDADKNARVKYKEISFHKTMIEQSLKKDKAIELESSKRSTDAHAVIDRIV